MKNWSNTIEKNIDDVDNYQIWRLEQLINFGLDGEKISSVLLKKFINLLDIDDSKKRYLKFLLKSNENRNIN